MDELVYYTSLYDLYGELLTYKQRQYFEDYYFNNLSLGEMSENYKVSRNAIFKQIRIVVDKLLEYEEKLKFFSKLHMLNELLDKEKNDKLKEDIEKLFYHYD